MERIEQEIRNESIFLDPNICDCPTCRELAKKGEVEIDYLSRPRRRPPSNK